MNPQNERTLHGRSTGFKDQKRVNGRDRQSQYTHPSRNLKPFDTKAYCQSVDQIIIDAVLMLSGWPACIRYSYFVGSNGRLLVRAERGWK
jgi:hypothetical protein